MRREGKLVKLYVRKSEVEGFSKIVEQAIIERRHKGQAMKTSTELLKQFRVSLGEKDRIIKTLRGIRV